MKTALIQFNSWDRFSVADLGSWDIKAGDWVVAGVEFGLDAGRVIKVMEMSDAEFKAESQVKNIERVAVNEDLEKIQDYYNQKNKAMEDCRSIVKRFGLEMKMVDCHFSLDDQRLTFAFIADGRIDFRNAVKELNRHFEKNVRLHQLGVRDEAKMCGDVGCCGLDLCCRSFLKKIGSVTSELAEQQQVVHRGSERLSGVCGRLKCCLAYEKELYEELEKGMPTVGTRVRTKHGRGEVCAWHTLRHSVDVKIDPEKAGERPLIVEVPIEK